MSQLKGFIFPAAAIPADIGARMKRLREELGWKQSDLARLSGIAMGTISKVESYQEAGGLCVRGRRPHAVTLIRLLEVIHKAGADFELKDIVPDWPEADPERAIGYGPLSRLRRQELGLTLKAVADATGVTVASLSRFERNICLSKEFYQLENHPIDGPMPRLSNKILAEALNFKSVKDHEDWIALQERGSVS